jgi:hypothetical protein
MRYAILLLLFCSCKKGEGWAEKRCWHCHSITRTIDTCNYIPYNGPAIKDASGNTLTCELQ